MEINYCSVADLPNNVAFIHIVDTVSAPVSEQTTCTRESGYDMRAPEWAIGLKMT